MQLALLGLPVPLARKDLKETQAQPALLDPRAQLDPKALLVHKDLKGTPEQPA